MFYERHIKKISILSLVFLGLVGFSGLALADAVCSTPPVGACTPACVAPQICRGSGGSNICINCPPAGTSASSGFGINLQNPLCNSGGVNGTLCLNNVSSVLSIILVYIRGIVLAIAVVVLIYAGFLYVTSGGEPSKIATAKKALLWAAVGIAIALAAEGLRDVVVAVIGS